MPANEPYRAWATFSFTAASGRTNECDLFIAVPGGVYLLELKDIPGGWSTTVTPGSSTPTGSGP